MIVVCEKCRTRFRLDDDCVPPEGTKVQCSRCHSRFHVKPSSSTSSPEPEDKPDFEDSPPDTRPEEPDLDNPEFLHDPPFVADDEPILGDEPAAAAPPSPSGAGFEPVVEAEGDKEDDGLGVGLDLGSDFEAFPFRGPVEESGPVPRVSDPEPKRAPDPPPRRRKRKPSQIELAEDGDPRRSRKERSASLDRDDSLAIPVPPGPPLTLQIAAAVLGLLLLGGAVRALVLFGTGASPGPVVITGAGWMAANFQTFHVHDLSGRRALVVRGSLQPEGQNTGAPPIVLGTLLDGRDRTFGPGIRAWPVWLRDEAFAPDRLPALIEGRETGPVPETPVPEGFTLLFPEPSSSARRIRIQLLPPDGEAASS